jgi:hypothetical protein
MLQYVRENLPLVVGLSIFLAAVLFSVLWLLGTTGRAPFIYSIF